MHPSGLSCFIQLTLISQSARASRRPQPLFLCLFVLSLFTQTQGNQTPAHEMHVDGVAGPESPQISPTVARKRVNCWGANNKVRQCISPPGGGGGGSHDTATANCFADRKSGCINYGRRPSDECPLDLAVHVNARHKNQHPKFYPTVNAPLSPPPLHRLHHL